MKDSELREYLGVDDFSDGIPFSQTDGEIVNINRRIGECWQAIDLLAETIGYKREYKSAMPAKMVFKKIKPNRS